MDKKANLKRKYMFKVSRAPTFRQSELLKTLLPKNVAGMVLEMTTSILTPSLGELCWAPTLSCLLMYLCDTSSSSRSLQKTLLGSGILSIPVPQKSQFPGHCSYLIEICWPNKGLGCATVQHAQDPQCRTDWRKQAVKKARFQVQHLKLGWGRLKRLVGRGPRRVTTTQIFMCQFIWRICWGEIWETQGKNSVWAGIEQEREAVMVASCDCLLDIAQSVSLCFS